MKRKPRGAEKPSAGAAPSRVPKRRRSAAASVDWILRLYVAGQTPKSLAAFANLKRICEEHLAGRYRIDVIDLALTPHLAQHDQIIALPTLVRKLPEPVKRILGDLSNHQRVLVGMELQPATSSRTPFSNVAQK